MPWPPPGNLPDRDQIHISGIAHGFFITEPPGKPKVGGGEVKEVQGCQFMEGLAGFIKILAFILSDMGSHGGF